MTSGRMTLDKYNYWISAKADGHGSTGQVKEASFFGRTIEVCTKKFNRGSFIDFLNAAIHEINKSPDKESLQTELKPLEKGNCLFGGSSDNDILQTYEVIIEKVNLHNIVTRLNPPSKPPINAEFDYRI